MDRQKIMDAVRLIIEGIGDDPNRKGVSETPDRFYRMCEELFCGIGKDPAEELKILTDQVHDEIVLVRNMPFYSMCEHHLLPFHGLCHVAYIPDKRITGVSKIIRVVDTCSRRLQIQERLTTEIADAIMRKLKPRGVMVMVEAEHLCMTMRGVRKPGSLMVTSCVRGIFRENAKTRMEALSLIKDVKR